MRVPTPDQASARELSRRHFADALSSYHPLCIGDFSILLYKSVLGVPYAVFCVTIRNLHVPTMQDLD